MNQAEVALLGALQSRKSEADPGILVCSAGFAV